MNARAPNERPTDTGAPTHTSTRNIQSHSLLFCLTRLVYWALTTVLSVGLRLLGPLRVVGLRPKSATKKRCQVDQAAGQECVFQAGPRPTRKLLSNTSHYSSGRELGRSAEPEQVCSAITELLRQAPVAFRAFREERLLRRGRAYHDPSAEIPLYVGGLGSLARAPLCSVDSCQERMQRREAEEAKQKEEAGRGSHRAAMSTPSFRSGL